LREEKVEEKNFKNQSKKIPDTRNQFPDKKREEGNILCEKVAKALTGFG